MSERDEQRGKLGEAMIAGYAQHAGIKLGCAYYPEHDDMLAALDAIGAAGFCVVPPSATGDMLKAGEELDLDPPSVIFRAMVIKGNLAGRKD